jgi:sterol desaturase/sphingolipid hydroxylase (fatty acid hydroxylase superfamily)
METFARALQFVLPLFMILILAEFVVAKYKHKAVLNSMDTISSLSSGLTNVLKQVLGWSISIISYDFLLQHLNVFNIQHHVLQYIIGFICIDFFAYWSHRWAHEYNILWNRHLVHHSSEEFNLPVALRQTISNFVEIYTFLLIPAAIFGVPTQVLVMLGVVMLFGGFWYHTQLIDKLGFLERFMVTPSHHRIHHAINPVYLDKNYGGILIIWDKLFGTFQAELPHEKPVYGITRPVQTWNPIKINFLHITLLIQDAWRTASLRDKLRIWFMPTGWRPADVVDKYPVAYTENIYKQEKYMPAASIYLKIWSWAQLIITFALVLYLFKQLANLPMQQVVLYSIFIFYSVYCYTSLMDRERFAWVLELIRVAWALSIIGVQGDWFGSNQIASGLSIGLALYFMVSLGISFAIDQYEFRNKTSTIQTSV